MAAAQNRLAWRTEGYYGLHLVRVKRSPLLDDFHPTNAGLSLWPRWPLPPRCTRWPLLALRPCWPRNPLTRRYDITDVRARLLLGEGLKRDDVDENAESVYGVDVAVAIGVSLNLAVVAGRITGRRDVWDAGGTDGSSPGLVQDDDAENEVTTAVSAETMIVCRMTDLLLV